MTESVVGSYGLRDSEMRGERDATVFAYTPPGAQPYPPYINLRRDIAGCYLVTVRSSAIFGADVSTGHSGEIMIPREQLLELFKALAGELGVPVSRRL